MKIYDCFLFSSELDLLKIRLSYLYDQVDYFVLVESGRTLTNSEKKLYYHENRHLFEKFQDKIIHIVAESNDLPAWEYEFFQRNSIKQGLKSCNPDDLIFISDVDEIVNISEVVQRNILKPTLVELSMYYYYLNFKVGTIWLYNLVSPYRYIKDVHIGDRNTYTSFVEVTLNNVENVYGWHFSYLFGNDIESYKSKIRSFSHQEFNTPYYLNTQRLQACIYFGIDLFERPYKFKVDPNPVKALKNYLTAEQQASWIYSSENSKKITLPHLYWLFRMKIVNRISNALRNRINRFRS
jgi:beta-1,4-mannosyl-glycoprotein beta-1,4-N-acetylglucosaminyltransferase